LNHFLNESKIKSKLKTILKFRGVLVGVVGKPSMSDLMEFISQFS
jgi:hypothetical protein